MNSIHKSRTKEIKETLQLSTALPTIPDETVTISDLTCTASDSTEEDLQLSVAWDSANDEEGDCLVFEVEWEGRVLWDSDNNISGSDTTNTSDFNITELVPYTEYTVTVMYENLTETCTDTTVQTGEEGREL